MDIQIFTDSSSDLPLSYFEENDIHLIPLQVHIGKENYLDLVTINPLKVYEEIRSGEMPKTSQATPIQLEEAFVELAKSKKPGIFLPISSPLSGTYQTAKMVHDQVKEEYPDLDLTIIDTNCVSLGLGMVIQHIVEFRKTNPSKDEFVQFIQFHCDHMEHLFTVEDLDFLAKGGRLSKASAFLGGLLNIKPLLHVEDGKLVPLEKIRGKKKLLKRLLDLMEERGADLADQTIGISHGDDEQLALEMKQMIEERFGTKAFYINIIGSVVASHAGPGTLAIFFLNKTYTNEIE